MNVAYLSTSPIQGHGIEAIIQSLRAQLQHSRAQQKLYRIQLNALQSIRSRISTSLQELSASYKKQVKSLEQKVCKIQSQNKQLKKQNALYELEVKNFQKRLLQKDNIISTILAKEFFVPIRGVVELEKREVVVEERIENVERKKSRGQEEGIGKVIVVKRQNELMGYEGVSLIKIESSQRIKQEIKLVQTQQATQNQVVINTKSRVEQTLQLQKPNQQQKAIKMGNLSPIKASVQIQQTQKQSPKQYNIVTKALQSAPINSYPTTSTINNHHHQDQTNTQQTINNQGICPIQTHLIQQPTPIFNTQYFQPAQSTQTTQLTSIQLYKKPIPPPKRIIPAKPVKPAKKPVGKKPISKYNTLLAQTNEPMEEANKKTQEHNYFQEQSGNNFEGQTNFLSRFGMATDYHHQHMVLDRRFQQSQDQQVQAVHLSVEQRKTIFDIVKDEKTIQNLQSETINFPKPQTTEYHFQNQNISHVSITRSKKSKHQKPRQVQHESINFAQDTIPVTQTITNPTPSQSFFESLATTQKPSHITSPHTSPYPQDDHQMHGLMDQSSIQQIDDHSMISNPIFPEDNEFERVEGTDTMRNGSTDGQYGAGFQKMVRQLLPHPSKKMSKKKAKRQTVEVMDPASFV